MGEMPVKSVATNDALVSVLVVMGWSRKIGQDARVYFTV